MVVVISPAPCTSGPCAQEQMATLTHGASSGSSMPACAEPNHHPTPCFGAVPPQQTPEDAKGVSDLLGDAVVS